MKKAVWFAQALFDVAVIGMVCYHHHILKREVSTTGKHLLESLSELDENLDLLDDRVSDLQADLELKINDVKNGIDRTISAEDAIIKSQKILSEKQLISGTIPAEDLIDFTSAVAKAEECKERAKEELGNGN